MAGLGAAFLVGAVLLNTRTRRRLAEQLEAVVTQRTAELTRQNAELVRQLRRESEEKTMIELEKQRVRLKMLRYQLNPHFLFNTLGSIRTALPPGPGPARRMVDRLVEFCRLTLCESDDPDWTTLGEEMRLLRMYLEIERARWDDLLEVEFACDPALADVRLPQFMLLPLVENALKYGRATSGNRVGIRLSARREPEGRAGSGSGKGAAAGDTLVIEIANTGEWIEPGVAKRVPSLGIGIRNLRERLAHHFPESHDVASGQADGWVTVTVKLKIAGEHPPAKADYLAETMQ